MHIDSYTSRRILLHIDSGSGYSSWIKKYLSAKEFYGIKDKNLNRMSIWAAYNNISDLLLEEKINLTKEDFLDCLAYNSKAGILILLYSRY